MSNDYKIVALTALSDNYMWLIHNGQQAVVIDPTLAAVVMEYLVEHNLNLAGILLTHSHADHTAGVAELCHHYGCAVRANFNYLELAAPQLADSPGLAEGEIIKLGNFSAFTVLLTPGHTRDHVCYLFDQQHLFCGDTLFASGCGRVFTLDFKAMYASLAKIKALDPQLLCYPAHEYTAKNLAFSESLEVNPAAYAAYRQQVLAKLAHWQNTLPTRLSDELRYNLFLRCEESSIWPTISRHSARPIFSGLECFTRLRELRNNF